MANESPDCGQIRLCSDKDAKGLIHRVDYDDPQSLKLKYGYAKHAQALGVGMWTASSIDCAKRFCNLPPIDLGFPISTRDCWCCNLH